MRRASWISLLLWGCGAAAKHPEVPSPPAPLPASTAGARCGWARGWAAETVGGRGGRVVRVTSLAATGPGSLAEALAASGPRIVVFEVGGVVDLAGATLKVSEPFVTVAGQTAPSPGITLIRGALSVAAHDVPDPGVWLYNPAPPVEFGAFGLNVDVAWRHGARMTVTGNSFAAPHIAGYAARIRAAHPGITPFEVKSILAATADNGT